MALAFSTNGKWLACGTEEGKVRLANTATGKWVREVQVDKARPWPLAVADDGKVLAAGAYSVITLWNTDNGKELAPAVMPRQPASRFSRSG